MRSLRWVGLMSSLLFVGVLGGLLVPLPSEAATPTLAIKIDGATVVPSGNPVGGFLITSSTTCNASETTLGYTACYGIRTSTTAQYGGSSRKYTIQNAPNSTARLRTAEKKGQDKFSLVGIQFVPVASTWAGATALQYNNEAHEIIITTRKVFDGAVNVDNAQTYVYALRTGGEFRAGPTTAGACGTNTSDGLCDSIGDSITYTGTGTFGPHSSLQNRNILSPAGSSKNTQPLSFTVAGPHLDPILSYDGLTNTTMGQVDPTYPRFLCTSNADGVTIAPPANCRPTVNHIMTVKLKGQDTFVLVGGVDDFSADCTAQLSAQQERQLKFLASLVKVLDWWEDRHPNVRLRAFITRIELILDGANNNTDPTCPGATLVNLDMATAAAEDYRDFVEHNAEAAVPAAPHYYAKISNPGVTWEQAKLQAEALGDGWHLATITSGDEQAFINDLLGDPPTVGTQQYWIGGEQLPLSVEDEPGGNWQWINGEGSFWNNGPIDGKYQNWGNHTNGPGVGLQPDNAGIAPPQNHLSLDNRYGWGWDDNDQDLYAILGYVAEGPFPLPPPIE